MDQLTPPARGDVLATGFGATVSMWLMAYVAMMQPGLVLGEIIFAAMLLCLVVAGFVVGVTRSGDDINLELDNGWVVSMNNVETILDPSLLEPPEDEADEE